MSSRILQAMMLGSYRRLRPLEHLGAHSPMPPPAVDLLRADDDDMVDAVAAALAQIANASLCCSGAHQAPIPVPAGMAARKTGRPARGRHRSRPASTRFVLPHVTVIEPAVRQTTADVVVAEGRVVDVLPPGSGPYEGYDVLAAYRGCFVLPALTDMHTHLAPHNLFDLIPLWLLTYLTHGITTIRDAGDVDGTSVREYHDGIRGGRFIGPRSFPAGPFIVKGETRWTNVIQVNEPADAEGVARELVRRGMKCMKIYENLTVEEIAALERAASQHGLNTLGHVPTRLGIEEAKLRDAQHFFGVAPPASLPRDHVLDRLVFWDAVDEKRIDTVVRSAVEGGLANTPTLVVAERLLAAGATGFLEEPSLELLPRFYRDVVWHPHHGLPAYRRPDAARVARIQRAMDKKFVLVRRLYEAGAPLRIGTDLQAYVVPGDALHKEMSLFQQAGIPAQVVLKMATRDAAMALGLDDLGVIRKGAIADLLVCSSNPGEDLGALKSMRAVAHGGALYPAEDLREELRERVRSLDRTFVRFGTAALARLSMWSLARRFTG
ncbi:MAG: amidohydrolase family protein [Betaproteobacteria bacterium]|nr:amidohydrolase family protein [Betaproteobacteria bacterium]